MVQRSLESAVYLRQEVRAENLFYFFFMPLSWTGSDVSDEEKWRAGGVLNPQGSDL